MIGQVAGMFYNDAGRDISGGLSDTLNALSVRKTQNQSREVVDEARRKKALVEDFAQIASLMDAGEMGQAREVVENRIELLDAMGIDPSHSKDLLARIDTDPASARKGVQSVLDMAAATGQYTDPRIEQLKLAMDAARLNKAPDAQFGSTERYKDSEGNIYTATQVRDPGTGGLELRYAPVTPGAPPQPVGPVSPIGSSGMTAAEEVTQAGRKERSVQDERYTSEKIKGIVNQISGLGSQMALYDQALDLLDDGANTGPIYNMLPNINAAAIELQNIKANLGLEVIQNTTFGALSESELAFALDTTMPTGLPPKELKNWIVRKKSAQKKLMSELRKAAGIIREKGVDGYLEQMGIELNAAPNSAPKDNTADPLGVR